MEDKMSLHNLTKQLSIALTRKFNYLSSILFLILVTSCVTANSQSFSEGFDVVVPLPTGWVSSNQSTTIGTTGWFQGGTTWAAQTGAATSWIGANFNNTTGSNDISNWLLTPNRTFSNGEVIKFWTRTIAGSAFPDRLQVRLSLNGASTNVGTGPAAVGDFTTLLLDINPTLAVGGYPEAWTEQTITISGLAAPTGGRIAFRYFVTFAGPLGDNSNIIGIDTFSYTAFDGPISDAPNDINGDRKSDFIIVRADGGPVTQQGVNDETGKEVVANSERRTSESPQAAIGWWTINNNGSSPARVTLGNDTDSFQTGDFDGDGKDDLCVWSPGAAGVAAFKILKSSTNTVSVRLYGQTGDTPDVIGDWNGDGKDDLAVYRDGTAASPQSFFYWSNETTPTVVNYIPWGTDGDVSYALDYDGDGKLDAAVQRNGGGGRGDHYIRQSSNVALVYVIYGLSSDFVVPGDYDGDGKDDIVVSRNANFGSGTFKYFWIRETDGGGTPQSPVQWGISGDFICQGDYDGDGKTDIAVWRSNVDPTMNYFYVRRSSDGALQQLEWGASGDYPVNNWNVH
jgi:hypothetical protein